MNAIFNLMSSEKWEKIKDQLYYKPSSLEKEGFIHCCTEEQVLWAAERFYNNSDEIVLLRIDTDRLESQLKFETSNEMLFPHIYGPLNLDAVVHVSLLLSNGHGVFDFVN